MTPPPCWHATSLEGWHYPSSGHPPPGSPWEKVSVIVVSLKGHSRDQGVGGSSVDVGSEQRTLRWEISENVGQADAADDSFPPRLFVSVFYQCVL